MTAPASHCCSCVCAYFRLSFLSSARFLFAAMQACTNVEFRPVNPTAPNLWVISSDGTFPSIGVTSEDLWFDCSSTGAPAAQVYGGMCYMVCQCNDPNSNGCVAEGPANIRNFYVRQFVNVAPANPASVLPSAENKGLYCSSTLTTQLTQPFITCFLRATVSCCLP